MLVTSVSVLLPVLFVMGLGYFAGRAKEFDADQVQGINELVIGYALPALMFVGIASTSAQVLLSDGAFLLALSLGFAGAYVLTLLFSLHVLRHSLGQAALQACSVAFPSVAFMGLPIFEGLFGKASLLTVTCGNALGTLLTVPATVVLLEIHVHRTSQAAGDAPAAKRSEGAIVWAALSSSARKAVVWAPLLALALVLLGLRVPDEVNDMLKLIGQTTSGVALFASGLVIAAYKLEVTREVIGNVLAKMAAQPLAVALFAILLGVSDPLKREAILVAALPTAVFPTLLAPRYGIYISESASTLVLTTLTMIVALPLAIFLTG